MGKKSAPSRRISSSDGVQVVKSNKRVKEDLPQKINHIKKKKKFKFEMVNPVDNTEVLRKAVASVKRPKDVMSGNWQAFLASTVKPVRKKFDNHVTKHKVSKAKLKNISKQEKSEIEPGTHGGISTPEIGPEEVYIMELDPKSEKEKHELTRCIAMDCEMVGVFDGKESVLARVSLVNQHGECVYDQFVKPKEKVTDYRTKVSGVRPRDLKQGKDFEVVQKEVADILLGKVLVGHALKNDLKVLMLSHPPNMVRDTSRFKPFRNICGGRTPSLKKLASEILGVTIQIGEHSSMEDAKATMQLYNLYQKEWENHRLLRKAFRRKQAIAAATGIASKVQRIKKISKTSKSPLLDEFAAF